MKIDENRLKYPHCDFNHLSGVGCGFLYQYRVESDERVGKAFPAITADEMRHDLYDGVLQKHVDSQGRVNYAALKSNPQALESYLDLLAAASPEDLPTPQARLAFWINAYNAPDNQRRNRSLPDSKRP